LCLIERESQNRQSYFLFFHQKIFTGILRFKNNVFLLEILYFRDILTNILIKKVKSQKNKTLYLYYKTEGNNKK
ncbi:MAG TPA: hypothetical protein DIT04_03175, partial [Dysgonomonas sp.]|nr:hypothetical protein [Dysgonomonas sp.]